jgi:hypothetical protein
VLNPAAAWLAADGQANCCCCSCLEWVAAALAAASAAACACLSAALCVVLHKGNDRGVVCEHIEHAAAVTQPTHPWKPPLLAAGVLRA